MFDIKEELKKLPTCPGVYMHKDSLGEIIYVGKAINLRNRVRSYFRVQAQADPKLRALVSNIAEFEYITCATEMEALILECNLIKKYMPRYNILLKDDKSYPFIQVTTTEKYPRVVRSHRMEHDGNRYFGPYTDIGALARLIRMIQEMYPLKRCRATSFPAGVRPCLNYFIGKCNGVCQGKVDEAEYNAMIDEILDVLSGHDAKVLAKLEAKMLEASDNLQFEDAAKYRDYIKALRQLGETQRATSIGDRDADVLIPVLTKINEIVVVYKVRDGKLIGREPIYMRDSVGLRDTVGGSAEARASLDGCEEAEGARAAGSAPEGFDDAAGLLAGFIKLHYTGLSALPREILLPMHIEDEDLLEELLNRVNSENAESKNDVMHKTKLLVPERGEKKALVKMAADDSIELSKSLDERAEREQERKDALRDSLTEVIEYAAEINGSIPMTIPEGDDREYRIEAYDISNLNGLDTVGAMVVYEGRKAIRSDYRKFKVRTAEGDDYGSLREVIYRRLKRARQGDEGFSTYPDLMLIDGGLGQVHAVKAVVDAFRIAIPVVGMAKDEAHRTQRLVFDDGREIDLKDNRLLFSYCGTIQEEVHRFAITYMSGVRGRKMTHSVLEDIPGIGPKRRAELLRSFGSIEELKKATYDDIIQVEGMTAKAAESVVDFLKEKREQKEEENDA